MASNYTDPQWFRGQVRVQELVIGSGAASANHRLYNDSSGYLQFVKEGGGLDIITGGTFFTNNVIQGPIFADGENPKCTTQTGASYTIPATTTVLFCNYTGGTMAVTLPAHYGAAYARQVMIKNLHATNAVTVTPAAGNINGAANYSLTAGKGIIILSDGTNWHIVSIF
jgi:hypothetical protein